MAFSSFIYFFLQCARWKKKGERKRKETKEVHHFIQHMSSVYSLQDYQLTDFREKKIN
jgi:hypothetical protein